MKRYYSILRPVAPGTFPKDGVIELHNFDDKQEVDGIGMAWGYIDYDRKLTQKEVEDYELIPAGMKTWYGVTTMFYDSGKVVVKITSTAMQEHEPKSTEKELSRKTMYVDWFDSREAADEWVKEALLA